jgi:hypothetical protein
MESLLSVLLFVGFLYLMMRFGCGAHMHGGCGHSSHDHGNTKEGSAEHDGENRHVA